MATPAVRGGGTMYEPEPPPLSSGPVELSRDYRERSARDARIVRELARHAPDPTYFDARAEESGDGSFEAQPPETQQIIMSHIDEAVRLSALAAGREEENLRANALRTETELAGPAHATAHTDVPRLIAALPPLACADACGQTTPVSIADERLLGEFGVAVLQQRGSAYYAVVDVLAQLQARAEERPTLTLDELIAFFTERHVPLRPHMGDVGPRSSTIGGRTAAVARLGFHFQPGDRYLLCLVARVADSAHMCVGKDPFVARTGWTLCNRVAAVFYLCSCGITRAAPRRNDQ